MTHGRVSTDPEPWSWCCCRRLFWVRWMQPATVCAAGVPLVQYWREPCRQRAMLCSTQCT